MMHKFITFMACSFLCLNGTSLALNTMDSGVTEINYNLAQSTLDNIITHLTYAEMVVLNDILTQVSSSLYTTPSTGIYAYLINDTGNTSTFTNWITTITSTNSGSYIKNPYIYKLAILNYGLTVQMQFVSSYVSSTTGYKTSKLAIFEPFLGKRILLVPYITDNKVKGKGHYIGRGNLVNAHKHQYGVTGAYLDYWDCYTDADEIIASSANGITEQSTSIISIAGGVLDGCTFVTAATLNTMWISI